jgi:hypothetical protein
VANADGTGTFTSTNQPYFAYHQILAKNAVSSAKTWQLKVPSTVTTLQLHAATSRPTCSTCW